MTNLGHLALDLFRNELTTYVLSTDCSLIRMRALSYGTRSGVVQSGSYDL